ncbi:hypothetical protein, partial [uncultured Rikenella sp.]|uniref:hypothetical protein n=1 Tax=uncultured Rikenella sp. TaxID=368003 RepID=UPI00260B3D9D
TASTPVLCPRAGGNLIQTQNTRLNDFLFQQSRAVELCSRALGNLVKTCQHILTISLLRRGARLWLREGTVLFVNKKNNKKKLLRMLTHPQAPAALTNAAASQILL